MLISLRKANGVVCHCAKRTQQKTVKGATWIVDGGNNRLSGESMSRIIQYLFPYPQFEKNIRS
jgi:hypothetical protein